MLKLPNDGLQVFCPIAPSLPSRKRSTQLSTCLKLNRVSPCRSVLCTERHDKRRTRHAAFEPRNAGCARHTVPACGLSSLPPLEALFVWVLHNEAVSSGLAQ